MKCPSCNQSLPTAMPECPNCRLTLRRLDTKFGALPRHSLYLTDRSGTLSLRAIKELRALLGLFQQKFPQSLFSVFIVGRVANGSISEYTFWLANRARFSSVEAGAGENFDLLLGIDLQARAAALLVGYGLENYLSERDLERALARASSAFHAGDVARGIRVCVEFMIDRMREVARDVEKHGPPKSDAPIMAER